MDEPVSHPRLLANWVISQMVSHMLADAPELEAKDYMVIRTAFRSAGGTWVAITDGDTQQLNLLKEVILAWGQNLPPKTQSEII